MFSIQLDSSYLLELRNLKNSSPLFSNKGCCNCSWKKSGATDTHTLEIDGKVLINRSRAHWLQSNALSFALGWFKIDLLRA